MEKVNFTDKFSKFDDLWSPKVVSELNDYQFKLVKLQGDFIGIHMQIQMKRSLLCRALWQLS